MLHWWICHAEQVMERHGTRRSVIDSGAAFRYAISRYGSMSNIPGAVAVRGGGSYVGY